MARLYRDKCKIMCTNTDSLIYYLECEDAYEDMKRNISRFDTSDYSEINAYDMPRVNKKIPGLMKDDNNGAIMTEFVGLRAKMYALRVIGKDDAKKIKGIKRNVVERAITFEDYTRCLRDEIEQSRNQSCLRSISSPLRSRNSLLQIVRTTNATSYPIPTILYRGDIIKYRE